MAKSEYSDKWFVRVDGNQEFLVEKLKKLSECLDTKALIAAYHLGEKQDNPHCHFAIECGSTQKQSFAKRMKALFGIEKRSQYAVDVWDGNRVAGAVAYLFHESAAKIITNVGFTDEELTLAKQACEATQKVVNVNKQKASGKLVEKALEQFKNQEVDRSDILLYMLKEIRDGGAYYPGEYRLKSFVEEVMVKRLGDRELARYARQLEERLWREG